MKEIFLMVFSLIKYLNNTVSGEVRIFLFKNMNINVSYENVFLHYSSFIS